MIAVSILTPLITGIVVLLLGQPGENSRVKYRSPLLAFLASTVAFVSAIILQKRFAASYGENQLKEVWWTISGNGINFSFALDGLSLPLFLATALLFLIAVIFSYNIERVATGSQRLKNDFWGLLLLLEAAVLGIFSAWNFVVFFMAWELFLIPLVVLLWRYGLADRRRAALKFFLYTFVSSAFLLFAFAAMVYYVPRIGADFDLRTTYALEMQTIHFEKQRVLFLFFMLAFLVKMPVFPFHAWLPLTHTQAPLGSLLLSGLFLKMGSYGILRFVTPNFTGVIAEWGNVFIGLGIVSMLFGGFAAFRQQSFRYVIAYSSLAHMGLMLAAMLTQNEYSVTGAIIQNVGHSLANALLFIVVTMHLVRGKSDNLAEMAAPRSYTYWLALSVAVFSAIGVPGTAGFTGEFLMLFGITYRSWFLAGVAVLTVVLSAVYMLRLYHKIRKNSADESWRPTVIERVTIAILVTAILWLGIAPGIIADGARSTAKVITSVTAGVNR